MDPDISKIAQLLVVLGAFGGFATTVAVAARVVLVRFGRKPREAGEGAARLDDTRLERIEHAVDAIAIEVERIAEAQRFAAKLMSERGSASGDRLPAAGDTGRSYRSVTPH